MIRKVYFDFIKDRISKKKFKWLLQQGRRYFLTHFSFFIGKPLCGPILGTFFVNYKCNYHCKMCDLPLREKQLRKKGLKELSTSHLKQSLKDFSDLGISGIGFTGGEPLLRTDIFELLKYTKDLGMITHLHTNGFFLTEQNIKKLLYINLDSITISLDGPRAEIHDTIRGYRGAFDKAINAISRINIMRKKMGSPIRVKIAAVINESNIDEVPGLVELSRSLKTDCIEFIPQQPFSASCKFDTLHFTNNFLEKLHKTIRYLLELKRKKVKIGNSSRHINLFEKSFKGEKSPVICYAGYNSLALDCYGEIFPCVPWVNWANSVANIKDITLKDFWYSPKYNKIRNSISKCKDCYLNCQTELNLLFNMPV